MTCDDLCALLRDALKARPEVRFALLFGSAVTRGLEQARDIDVAISFSDPPALMVLAALADDLERIVGREVDVVDVEQASTLLRWEIVRTGREVVALDRDALRTFQARVPIEYFDLRPYFDRESAGLHRVLTGA